MRKPKKRWTEQCLVALEKANNKPYLGIQEDIYITCLFWNCFPHNFHNFMLLFLATECQNYILSKQCQTAKFSTYMETFEMRYPC